MSELSIFEGNSLVSSDLFKSLHDAGKNLLGGSGGGMRRISIRGKRFREIVGGEEMRVSKSDSMNIVIIDAAEVSRTYYEGVYSPDKPASPHCWSLDTQVPSPDVPEDQRMSPRCIDCKMNIKGSGQGTGRACRFQQRLVVALEGQLDKVYQLQLPATSVFGASEDGKLPMQAYARFLNANDTPPIAVVTEMYFDDDSDAPKLFFKPLRPLTEEELGQAAALLKHPDTKRGLTFTVSKPKEDVDVSAALTKLEPKKAKKVKIEVEEDEGDELEEPKKVAKKPDTTSGNTDPELDAIVNAWNNK